MQKIFLLSEKWRGKDGKMKQQHIAICTESQLIYFMEAHYARKQTDYGLMRAEQEYVKTEIPVNQWLDIGTPPVDLSSVDVLKIAKE